MRSLILDSELIELASMLRRYDLQFLGQRAPALAEELAELIDEHLDAAASFFQFDPRTEQDFLDD